MSRSLALLLVLPVTHLAAQANPFVFFPQDPERHTITCASYIGRPDWNAQAEGFVELNSNWFRGVGDESSSCWVRGMFHWATDDDRSTVETYDVILRSADPTGMIDPSAAGEIVRIAGLTLPTLPAGGQGTWVMSDFFATPAAVPCTQSWFMGLGFPASPGWPTSGDGHSLWRADIPGITPATVGEFPRANAPDANWTVRPSGQVFSNGWSYIMGVLVDGPTLHVGGLDPNNTRQGLPLPLTQANIGLGGLFPDVSGAPRSDGITLRVQDNVVPQGVAFCAAASNFGNPPLPFPGIFGQFHLDIAANVSLGFGLLNGGALDFPVFPPGAIAPVFQGVSLKFQAAIIDPASGNIAFSNAQATEL